MHSFVFQLSTRPVSKEDWLTEEAALENIRNSLGANATDYVDTLSDEDRSAAITSLVCKWLPEELFETNADGTFTYKGGIEKWVRTVYIPGIKEAASMLDKEKVFRTGPGSAFEIEKAIKNPLDLGSLFIIHNDGAYNSPATLSGAFMEEFVRVLEPGDRIYVGAVFDHHF